MNKEEQQALESLINKSDSPELLRELIQKKLSSLLSRLSEKVLQSEDLL